MFFTWNIPFIFSTVFTDHLIKKKKTQSVQQVLTFNFCIKANMLKVFEWLLIILVIAESVPSLDKKVNSLEQSLSSSQCEASASGLHLITHRLKGPPQKINEHCSALRHIY